MIFLFVTVLVLYRTRMAAPGTRRSGFNGKIWCWGLTVPAEPLPSSMDVPWTVPETLLGPLAQPQHLVTLA